MINISRRIFSSVEGTDIVILTYFLYLWESPLLLNFGAIRISRSFCTNTVGILWAESIKVAAVPRLESRPLSELAVCSGELRATLLWSHIAN